MDDSFDISNRHDSEANTAQQSNIINPEGVAQQFTNPVAGQITVAQRAPLRLILTCYMFEHGIKAG
jgi:hypothetical protein